MDTARIAKARKVARQMARQRRIVSEAETKAGTTEIENWTAAAFTGVKEGDRALQVAASVEDTMADGLLAWLAKARRPGKWRACVR